MTDAGSRKYESSLFLEICLLISHIITRSRNIFLKYDTYFFYVSVKGNYFFYLLVFIIISYYAIILLIKNTFCYVEWKCEHNLIGIAGILSAYGLHKYV